MASAGSYVAMGASGGGPVGNESEAEGSNHGWSDQGWSAQARPSTSSDDPQEDQSHAAYTSSQAFPSGSHRRQPIMKPSIHIGGSNIALDALTDQAQPSHPHSFTISPSPLSISNSTPSKGSSFPHDGYANYPRARRKSISHTMGSDDEKEGYQPSGSGSYGRSTSSNKKKRRTASFSLPVHRRKRNSANGGFPSSLISWWSGGTTSHRPRSRKQRYTILFIILLTLGFVLYQWHKRYQIQVEFSVFSRRWISEEINTIPSLKGCFNPNRISPEYNLTRHLAPKRQILSPGISLRRGMSCYDFSSTIQPIPAQPLEPLIYHTYWRSDLIPFGQRHTALLTSFLATQPLSHSKLILWTNGLNTVANNEYVSPFIKKWGDYIEVREVSMGEFARGTDLEGIVGGRGGKDGGVWDERGWVDGDAVRLLVLWHFGGVWLDMDMILTRDLHPLVEQEFVTQWDCYDKSYQSLNGALMHFQKHSPYLCEFFHLMSTFPLPKPATFTWGSHLYSKLHRSLLLSHLRPFSVLPWCFSDPRNCRADIRFPDPFDVDPAYWGGKKWEEGGRELLEEKVGFVWAVHLHNQWLRGFATGGWVERLLGGYEEKVEEIERYAKAFGGLGSKVVI